MNTYYVSDKSFANSDIYKEFLRKNPKVGSLRVHAYAAREAVPIEGLKVEVSTIVDNNRVVFFEGYTDESGNTIWIVLPAPSINLDNLVAPEKMTYSIRAIYPQADFDETYKVNIYEKIFVVQDINIRIDNIGGL